jgi:Lrp/AsnC family transcriptional regulator, leucine-responsive regulatory protein
MDALDLKILATLDADARRPYADVARELDVSQPTIADRIRRLESRGIVRGAMLCVDLGRLGYNVCAFVRLRATYANKLRLTDAARAMPQIIEMHSVTGDDCLIARVVARSVEELAEILQRLSAFAESSTSVMLETIIPLRNPIPAQQSAPLPKPGMRRSSPGRRSASMAQR